MNNLIMIINGGVKTQPLYTQKLFYTANLVVCTNPEQKNLFSILKSRYLPKDCKKDYLTKNITFKTLGKFIDANLSK